MRVLQRSLQRSTGDQVSLLDEALLSALELADLLDPAFATDVVFSAFTAYGTQGEVRLHVLPDVVFSTAQDRLARALSGRPWLASAL